MSQSHHTAALHNLDLCAICGSAGHLICCDLCPRAFHRKCLEADVPKGKRTFACMHCKKGSYGFSLRDVNLQAPEDLNRFIDFIEKDPVDTGNTYKRVRLGSLLQYLEAIHFTKVPDVARVMRAFSALQRIANTNQGSRLKQTGKGVSVDPQLLLHLELAVGAVDFKKACDHLAEGHMLPVCLAITPLQLNKRCLCGRVRLLRTFCWDCGALFDVKRDLFPNVSSSSLSCQQAAAALSLRELMSIDGVAAAERGIDYFASCMEHEETVVKFGGDMIFLFRGLVCCAPPHLAPKVATLFHKLLIRWQTGFSQLSTEGTPECADLLNLVEGLHASTHASREGGPVCRILAEHKVLIEESCGCKRRLEGSEELEEGEEEGNRVRRSGRTERNIVFDLNSRREQARRVLDLYNSEDVMGFDPRRGGLPLTPRKHCGNCGRSDNPQQAPQCKQCQQLLRESVDYGTLTDAVVWAYVFRDTEVPLQWGRESIILPDIARLLPLARCYQRIDELGADFFKLQCYFLTHLLYALSDWGQHTLHRQLFAEEFEFIVSNLTLAVRLRDPEIVAEFVQCLKILQFTPESDPELCEGVLEAVRFLLDEERERGSRGEWRTKREQGNCGKWLAANEKVYDRYHASFCAAAALMDYPFVEDAHTRMNPPSPMFFKYLHDHTVYNDPNR